MLDISRYLTAVLGVVIGSLSIFSYAEPDVPMLASGTRAVVATTMPESNVELFENWNESEFATFFYDKTVDFSQYDHAIFFPMTFDRMELAAESDDKFKDSWADSTFDEMDKVCQYFDDFAAKKFKSSKHIKPTNKGGPNVLAIEFRMKEFFPMSLQRKDALGTVGESKNQMGVGVLTFQAVLVESQSGRLVAVIEDQVNINAGSYTSDDRVGRNLAWRRSFRIIIDNLHDDFVRLQKTSAKQ
jgi:hypothetical protein